MHFAWFCQVHSHSINIYRACMILWISPQWNGEFISQSVTACQGANIKTIGFYATGVFLKMEADICSLCTLVTFNDWNSITKLTQWNWYRHKEMDLLKSTVLVIRIRCDISLNVNYNVWYSAADFMSLFHNDIRYQVALK